MIHPIASIHPVALDGMFPLGGHVFVAADGERYTVAEDAAGDLLYYAPYLYGDWQYVGTRGDVVDATADDVRALNGEA